MEIFEVGKSFNSYADVENSMKEYEKQTFAKYWKRDARLINSKRIERPVRPELKYIELKFCCIYGGQKFRPSGSGIRDVGTFKKEELCPAHVYLRVTVDGKALKVRSISDTHNHETNKTRFQSLPHQRKLGGKNKSNKKLVNHRRLAQQEEYSNVPEVDQSGTYKSNCKTHAEKRKNALLTTDSLANLAAASSDDVFDQKIDTLKTLELLWRQGKNTRIQIISDSENEDISNEITKNVPENIGDSDEESLLKPIIF